MSGARPGSGESAVFTVAPVLGGVDLLSATFRTHSYARHVHEGYAIGVIAAGAERFYYRGSERLAVAGSIVALDPDQVHDGSAAAESGWSYRMSYVRPESMVAAAREVDALHGSGLPSFPEPVVADPELASRFLEVHRIISASQCGLESESEALMLLAALLTRHARPRPAEPRAPHDHGAVARIRDALEDLTGPPPSLRRLADLSGLSPLYVIRAFRRATGFTPHAYQLHLRVQEAARRLKAGHAIADAAVACGFADQSHLTRCFKRVMGVPPGRYRRASRQVSFKTAPSGSS